MSTYELQHLETGDQGFALVALAGELDLTNSEAVERRLQSEVDSADALVVDLNRVVFVDSAALHCFFRLARSRGPSRFAVVLEPGSPIRRVVEIVNLGRAATIVPSLAEARAALAASEAG